MAGVVDSAVGYIGGASASPTYDTVCSGDGHTEALRLTLDESVLSYEQFLEAFVDNPRVATHPRPGEKVQYKTAVWAQGEAQAEIARRVVEDSGKAVPVERATAWTDAEDWHQHFYKDFKDFPEDDE